LDQVSSLDERTGTLGRVSSRVQKKSLDIDNFEIVINHQRDIMNATYKEEIKDKKVLK